MKTLRNAINKLVEGFSVLLIAVMVLLVLWQVIARYILNSPSAFSEALTRYLFVWLVLSTATYAFGSRDHMYISALNDKLSGSAKTVVSIIIEVLTILFAACVMTYGGITIASMQMVSMDSSLHIPMGIVYAIIPVCGVITVFYCLCNIADEFDRAGHALLSEKSANSERPANAQGISGLMPSETANFQNQAKEDD